MIIVEQVVYIINNGKQVDEHKRGTVQMALTAFTAPLQTTGDDKTAFMVV